MIDTLPSILSEASGIAPSAAHSGIFWVHNDSDTAALFALDLDGRLLGRTSLGISARPPADWEDIAVSPCGADSCIYLADIGDNNHERDHVRILRLVEPAIGVAAQLHVDTFPFVYPDGPHDAEAVFVLPGERVFVVSKGRDTPAILYRYPGQLRAERVTLQAVQALSPGVLQFPDMITGAAAAPEGDRVALRTYQYLRIMQVRGDSLVALMDSIPLHAAGEGQGEGVAWSGTGDLLLVGERGLDKRPASYSRMRCERRGGTIPAP